MDPKLIKKVEDLDKIMFGERTLPQLISALAHQVDSMREEPTEVVARKQLGDILFILTAVSRNKNWPLDDLLNEAVTKLLNRQHARHYYEAHITIEPVFGNTFKDFKTICEEYDFRPATLLMQKRKGDTPKRSAKDAFCTGRSISRSDLQDRMIALVRALTGCGFTVWRYKIESTLLDSRHDDSLFKLDHSKLPEKERSPRAPAAGALAGRAPRR